MPILQTDRNVIWVHCRGEYILDGSGNITHIVGTIHNITERKKAELAMKEAIELKDLFTDIMSHDLMNPATAVATTIGLDVQTRSKNWVVSISDQGEGIMDENKTKVFNRFERVGKKAVKGSGLGLAIANRVVNLHGGKIWIDDNPGGGSIFNVELTKCQ